MLVAVAISKFPRIELKDDERAGSTASYFELFKKPYVWLFFLGIFCYVSTEQGTSIFMSTFLEKYHSVDTGNRSKNCKLFLGMYDRRMSYRNASIEIIR